MKINKNVIYLSYSIIARLRRFIIQGKEGIFLKFKKSEPTSFKHNEMTSDNYQLSQFQQSINSLNSKVIKSSQIESE